MSIMNVIMSIWGIFSGPLIRRWCIYSHEKRHWKKAKEIYKEEKGIIILSGFSFLKKKLVLKKEDVCIQITHKEYPFPSGFTFLESDYLAYTDDEIVQIAHSGGAGLKARYEERILYIFVIILQIGYLFWSKATYVFEIFAVSIVCYVIARCVYEKKMSKTILRRGKEMKIWLDGEIEKAPGEFKKYMQSLSSDDNLRYRNHVPDKK